MEAIQASSDLDWMVIRHCFTLLDLFQNTVIPAAVAKNVKDIHSDIHGEYERDTVQFTASITHCTHTVHTCMYIYTV